MKKILLLLLLAGSISYAQHIIQKGNSVNVDGKVEKGEWDDAKEYVFTNPEIAKCRVLLKHDGNNLLMLYLMKEFKDSIIVLPEFFIDSKNNKGVKWENDDYWFHVSAQDCYSIGKREDYSKCKVEGEQWHAVPNYPFGNNWKRIEEIEISVSFEFANLKPGTEFGLCLSVAIYPENIRKNIPAAASEDKPLTWPGMIIGKE